jgi:hypothetical protein
MSTILRYVGNFFELGYDQPNAPSLRACRGNRSRERKVEVLGYLRAGKMFMDSPGIDRDFFDERRRADTRSLMTDGVYVWPELLRYYVDEHDVELPQDFEAHMSANGWRPPGSVDITQLALPESQR